jgi:hypothetical protein
MTAATWFAILILGPGSVAVFVLFLRDARKLLLGPDDRPATGAGGEEPLD